MSDASRKSPVIGYLTYDGADSWEEAILNGVADCARRNKVTLLCFACNIQWYSKTGIERNFNLYEQINETCDALISTEIHSPWVMERLGAIAAKPKVSVNFSLAGTPSVTVDYSGGMYLAVSHLIEAHGLKRIAYVRGPDQADTNARFETYKKALRDHGLVFDESLVTPPSADQSAPCGRDSMRALLARKKGKFDAVAANNDSMALGAMDELGSQGIRVPQDAAVIGFDDRIEATFSRPPLSSVRAPIYRMGWRAMELMLAQLRGEEAPALTTLPTELSLRNSCGCLSRSVRLATAPDSPSAAKARRGGAFAFSPRLAIERDRKRLAAEIAAELGADLAADHAAGLAADEGGARRELAGRLVGEFLADLKDPAADRFLAAIELFNADSASREESFAMVDAISVLRRRLLPYLGTRSGLMRRAETIWHKAQIMASEHANQGIMRDQAELAAVAALIQDAGQSFITNFKLDALMDLALAELRKVGMPSAYIILHRDAANPSRLSALAMGYRKGEEVDDHLLGSEFPTARILPGDLLGRSADSRLMVWPMRYQEESLGYIVFEIGPDRMSTYRELSLIISSAIKGSLLIREIEEHSRVLVKGIQSLTATMEEMSRSIESISGNVLRQASAVNQGAGSIAEMVKNIDRIAKISDQNSTYSKTLNTIAGAGGEAVRRSIDAINEVASFSEKILEFLDLIKGISEQTNTLAMNAAIQAAHAGEYGKGFNVVAQEIQRLADNTNENAVNIEKVMRTIVSGIDTSAKTAMDTGSGLESIISYASQNELLNRDLSLAMAEQDNGAKEILKATQELVEITGEIGSAMGEQKRAMDSFFGSVMEIKRIASAGR